MYITQITPVKGRYDRLKINIRRWLSTDIDQLVVVDFACPDKSGERILESPAIKRDGRVNVLFVDPLNAGPFYLHGKACNLGSSLAKYGILFFLDCDTFINSFYLDKLKDSSASGADAFWHLPPDSLKSTKKQFNLKAENKQFAIKNSLFYKLNGFHEGWAGYGAETIDLALRAQKIAKNLYFAPADNLISIKHSDEERFRFKPFCLKDTDKIDEISSVSYNYFGQQRKSGERAQPLNKMCALKTDYLIAYRNKQLTKFIPFEE